MADPIVVVCPKCQKKMKVPAEAAGKKVRCAGCQTAIPVQAPAAGKKTAPAKAAAPAKAKKPTAPGRSFEEDDGPAVYGLVTESQDSDSDEEAPAPAAPPPKPAAPKLKVDGEDDNPYGITASHDTARCPHCAKEMESEDAIICLNCGYNTQSRIHAQTRRVLEITFWDWCVWLGPGIGCVLAILILLGFDYWFDVMLHKTMWKDMDESIGTSSFSQGFRLWITAMTIWVMWKAARFAFRRLILNPRPPEVEVKT